MKLNILILLLFTLTISGCWPEDELIEPIYYPITSQLVSIPHSIYDYEIFYNLKTNELVSYNHKSEWDLGFESTPEGEHIILNSADLFEVSNLGQVDFATTLSIPDDAEFFFDASSGNFDSLAINNWVNTNTNPYEYSGNLYLLGRKEGAKYKVYRKMKFINLTASSYTMLIGNVDATAPDTFVIEKDPTVNFTNYKVLNEVQKINNEPTKTNWDIKFNTYSSILFDEDGTPTKYSVRGTLLNPGTIAGEYYISESVADSTSKVNSFFAAIDSTYIDSVELSSSWDAIGWEWKAVTIDESTNTAFYKADPRMVFIIKNHSNQYFKLHFTSYYNNQGVKGYPSFEYEILK